MQQLTSFFQEETCQWIADRTAAPLQKGNIDSISVPLILNRYFIFLMALMRVIKKFGQPIVLHPCMVPCYIFYFTNCMVKMSVILIERFNLTQNLKNMCPLTVCCVKKVSHDGILQRASLT